MKIIAHRGASGYAPENTLPAFELALDQGVDMIELDVAVCATGELVLIHDLRLEHLTGKPGYVNETSWEELQTRKIKGTGEIITLQTALECINARVPVMIDLKNDRTLNPVVSVIENCLHKGPWQIEDFFLSTFNHFVTRDLSSLLPVIKRGITIEGYPLGLADLAHKAEAQVITQWYEWVCPEMVAEIHDAQLELYVWGVDYPDDLARMESLGIDGVITNYPKRLRG